MLDNSLIATRTDTKEYVFKRYRMLFIPVYRYNGMSRKIRVTIDLDQAEQNMREHLADQSLQLGVHGCDKEGAYHMYYHSRTNLVEFTDVEVIEE